MRRLIRRGALISSVLMIVLLGSLPSTLNEGMRQRLSGRRTAAAPAADVSLSGGG